MSEPHQQVEIARKGLMLVLSSPSGAGKTTISRRLLEADDNLVMSISVTTRPKRPGEVDGVDYHFVDPVSFNLMVNRQELLEHAKVFDHYYGTPKAPVFDYLAHSRAKGSSTIFAALSVVPLRSTSSDPAALTSRRT